MRRGDGFAKVIAESGQEVERPSECSGLAGGLEKRCVEVKIFPDRK